MAAVILVPVILSLVQSASAQDGLKVSEFTIGEAVEYHSKVLNEKRRLNVYIPASYSTQSDKKYPVIYLLDGSADEDFIHIAGIVQFGSFSWIKMVPESIVVGIVNVDRKRDFTPPAIDERDKKEFPTAGGADKFVEMLKKEIQPLIDKRYRTQDSKTLIGQSLGGLLATQILFNRPEMFHNYIIVSPSLWWNDGALLKSKPKKFLPKTSIFIAVGKEGEIMEQVAKQLRDKIEGDKATHVRLFYHYFPELDHGDTLHLAVYKAFKEIFGGGEKR